MTTGAAPRGSLSNAEIGDALARIADLLETQAADGFRVRAYRRGAKRGRVVEQTPEPAIQQGSIVQPICGRLCPSTP